MERTFSAVLAALFISAVVITSTAQDKPIAEVTASYQFDRLMLSENGVSTSSNVPRGWDSGVNIPILQWFGVVGDVGHIWQSESALFSVFGTTISTTATGSLYTFGGGPQLTYRKSHAQPFARCILGDAHSRAFARVASTNESASGSARADSFFIAPGGGADFQITSNAWLRGGAEYFRTSRYGATVNGIRVFAGITFTFGGTDASFDQQRSSEHPEPQHPANAIHIATLGITVTTRENAGAQIVTVTANGVAAISGLHSGDIINALDGASIRSTTELAAHLANRAGNSVRIGYLVRGQWQAEAIVVLGQSR